MACRMHQVFLFMLCQWLLSFWRPCGRSECFVSCIFSRCEVVLEVPKDLLPKLPYGV